MSRQQKFRLSIRLPSGWKLSETILKEFIERDTIIIVDKIIEEIEKK